MAKHLETGLKSEDAAAEYLEKQGFRILERRYRCLGTDIDIVVQDNDSDIIRFVEVKGRTRSATNHNSTTCYDFSPEAALTENRGKEERMLRAAEHYLKTHNRTNEMAIDLIAIEWHPDGTLAEVRYYPGISR